MVRDLRRLHKGRGDLEWSWRRYDEAAAGAGDPEARLALVERLVIRPLDETRPQRHPRRDPAARP